MQVIQRVKGISNRNLIVMLHTKVQIFYGNTIFDTDNLRL